MKTCHQDTLDLLADHESRIGAVEALTPLGYNSCLVEWKDDDEIYVREGQIDVSGTVVTISSTQTIATSSLSNSTQYYIYISSAGVLSYSGSAPGRDTSKLGYYNGALRCIGFFRTDGSGNIIKFAISGNNYIYIPFLNPYNGSIETTGRDVEMMLPLGSMICEVHIRMTTNYSMYIYPKGDSARKGSVIYMTNLVNNTTAMNLLTSDDGYITFEANGTDTGGWINVNSFTIPNYIYTGA